MSPHQFSIFRVILGLYLTIHFVELIPWAPELFSSSGMVGNFKLNPTSSIFPNVLYIFDTQIFTQVFVGFLAALSFSLVIGFKRRYVAFLLWFGWACLFNRNIFIGNPGLPFIGLVLLMLSFLPSGEPWSRDSKGEVWRFDNRIHLFFWVVLSLGYTVSGIHKLGSPSWVDGTALFEVLNNPLARDTFLREFLVGWPWLLKIMTWSALVLEILFFPLFFFKKVRPYIWLAMVSMHLGIIMTIDFADLTIGVLMIHLLIFDSRWLKPKKIEGKEPILFFDGVCGLCNGFIDFLFAEDQGQVYKVAALQGETAKEKLNPSRIDDLNTLVVLEGDKELQKSEAVLSILYHIGGIWRLLSYSRILPLGLRDFVYDQVASNRYSFFGKKETCRLPTPDERSRFMN